MSLMQKAWSSEARAPGEEGTWEPPPAENQPAMLVGILDLGTHKSEYQGEEKDRAVVYLVWELTSAPKSGMTGNHTIGQIFTNSFHKKAGLRQMIEKHIKRPIPDGEVFDLRELFKLPWFLDVVTKEITTRAGEQRTVANINAISTPPRGVTVPPATIAPLYWEFDPRHPLPNQSWLPLIYGKTVAQKLQESSEWKKAAASGQTAAAPQQQPQQQPAARQAQTAASAPTPPPPSRKPEPPAGTRQKVDAFNPMTVQRFWVETVEDGVREMDREALKTLVDTFEKEANADANIGVVDYERKCGDWKVPSFFGVVPNPF